MLWEMFLLEAIAWLFLSQNLSPQIFQVLDKDKDGLFSKHDFKLLEEDTSVSLFSVFINFTCP